MNPDLLEQRIGRLDRIGQRHTIDIHVPYLSNSAQEKLFRWYHEGINLFTSSCSVGFTIYQEFAPRLLAIVDNPQASLELVDSLIKDTRTFTNALTLTMQEGRDKLLELHSCNEPQAQMLIAEIEAEENP